MRGRFPFTVLNPDPGAMEGNRRPHKHSSHRRRHPSEVKVAMMARDIPKGLLDPRKSHSSHLLKSCIILCFFYFHILFIFTFSSSVSLGGSEFTPGSDGDREANKLASLSPGPVNLPDKTRISQVACGLHHTGNFPLLTILWCITLLIIARCVFFQSFADNRRTSVYFWEQQLRPVRSWRSGFPRNTDTSQNPVWCKDYDDRRGKSPLGRADDRRRNYHLGFPLGNFFKFY